ncbi:MAG: hypothetical protein JNK65_08745 [Deltaproteobacteria bacterium]|nr:hypothetical protein [Deltaproteobacteria bacterium]
MMSEKEKKYWDGIKRVSEEHRYPPASENSEEALEQLNRLYRLQRLVRPDLFPPQDEENPPELEFYRKWMKIRNKRESSPS